MGEWRDDRPVVVGLLGRAGSGKTTAAKYLEEHHGFKRVSFAAPLKQIAQSVMGFSGDQLYGATATKEAVDPRYGMTPIQFLQRLGEAARNELGLGVWARAAVDSVVQQNRRHPHQDRFVIDDCRYVNEVDAILDDHRIQGRVVKLVCPDAESTRDATHPSEAQVDQVARLDLTIEVAKSPGSRLLKEAVEDALPGLLAPPEPTGDGWMLTYTGQVVYVDRPDPDVIVLEDVARSHSRVPRFLGHLRVSYYIAQHSVVVSHAVSQEYARAGLLHDGPETFLGDLIRPVKRHVPRVGEPFTELEHRWQRAFEYRFDLAEGALSHPVVDAADKRVCQAEKRDLFAHYPGKVEEDGVEPTRPRIVPLSEDRAYDLFMGRAEELGVS